MRRRIGSRKAMFASGLRHSNEQEELIVSEVLRTNELQAWFLSEGLVNVPLVEAKEPSVTVGAA